MAGSWQSTPLPPGWKRIRLAILQRDPICRWGLLPDEDGPCYEPSTECDHIGDPGDHRPGALRGICHPHHERRNQAQRNAGRSAKPSRKRPRNHIPRTNATFRALIPKAAFHGIEKC